MTVTVQCRECGKLLKFDAFKHTTTTQGGRQDCECCKGANEVMRECLERMGRGESPPWHLLNEMRKRVGYT